MIFMSKKDIAKEHILKRSDEPEGLAIKGFDFSRPFDIDQFLDACMTTGAQATHLAKAVEIAKKMRKDNATIFLGYTSNMVTTGVREAIVHLVKNRMVHAIVTTAGGVEEDFIKTLKPFILGDFRLDGTELRRMGINRAGNILIPNSRYIEFEKHFTPLLEKLLKEQKETGKIATPSEIARKLGEMANETSILFWAAKNNIPVFCPGMTDGSMGDMLFFFKTEHPEFKIDITDDSYKLTDMALDAKETAAIILGGSLPKHAIMNANIPREGAKYAIYINTSIEADGSDSGALPEEAKSWGKATADCNSVKVHADATIVFPLLVAGAFM